MKLPRPNLPVFICLAVAGGVVAYVAGGRTGLTGYCLGAGSGAFNMLVMWAVVSIMGNAYRQSSKPGRADALLAVAFLLKLPVYVAAGMVSHRVGGASDGAFLGAIALVYFALIWWALTRS